MDRRLIIEILPGAIFLFANALGGLLWAAGAATAATAVAVYLRWQWDGRIPWLAVSTLVLAFVLTMFGIFLNDETFVMVRPTIGTLAFSGILAVGALARPSLLERTFDSTLQMDTSGWRVLHIAWIVLVLFSAIINEVARRILTTDQWVIYGFLSDLFLFGLVWIATRFIAERYWID